MRFKYILLKVERNIRKIRIILPLLISFFFLFFSFFTCIVILLPNVFDRAPILSYLISECELPILYELHGRITLLDKNNDVVVTNSEVFIGGYSLSTPTSTEFDLKFSSPKKDEVFVVIRFDIEGEFYEVTKCLNIKEGKHVIEEEFVVYV